MHQHYFTVILQVAFFPLAVFTVIVAVPFFSAFTLPFLSTVATFLLELVQVSLSVEEEGVIVAFKVRVLPFATVALVLFNFTLVAGTFTVTLQVAFFPPDVFAVIVTAVSYTHLDVYKRQDIHRCVHFQCQIIAEICNRYAVAKYAGVSMLYIAMRL